MCKASGIPASNYERLTEIKMKIFDQLQHALKEMEIEAIKTIVHPAHLSALYLLYDISIQSEDYKICEAIKQVIAERPIKTSYLRIKR